MSKVSSRKHVYAAAFRENTVVWVVAILGIALLALTLRLWFLSTHPLVPLRDDAGEYERLARNIWQEHCFCYTPATPTYRRVPFYPFFIATLYAVFGRDPSVVRIAQAVVSSLICLSMYGIGKQLFDARVGLLAAFAYAIYPPAISMPSLLVTETLFTFLLMTAVLLLVVEVKHGRARFLLIGGVLLGCATLTRPIALFFPVFASAVVYLKKRRRALRDMLLLIAGFAIVVLPWLVRNYLVFGLVMLQVDFGHLLWLGTLKDTHGGFAGWEYPPSVDLVGDVMAEEGFTVKVDQIFLAEGLRNIQMDPVGYFWLCLQKLFLMYKYPYIRGFENGLTLVQKIHIGLTHVLALILTPVSLAKMKDAWPEILLPILLVVYFTASHTLLTYDPRFVAPLFPVLLVLAAAGMIAIYESSRGWYARLVRGSLAQ